jgi:hypothetical protein
LNKNTPTSVWLFNKKIYNQRLIKESRDVYENIKVGWKARRLESLEAERLIFRAIGGSIKFIKKYHKIGYEKSRLLAVNIEFV